MELTDFQLESIVGGSTRRSDSKRTYPNKTHSCRRCGKVSTAIAGYKSNGKHIHCCPKGHGCWHH